MSRTAKENVKERILDAAEKRLWHFGLKKTTMDEVAADAGIGKGTVYLYFESKEDIALAIMARYKEAMLIEQAEIARDPTLEPLEKIRRFLKLPLQRVHQRCVEYPQAIDIALAIKPHMAARFAPYMQQEVALLASVIEEGNRQGQFAVEDTLKAAHSLKFSTLGFMPPFPCVYCVDDIDPAVDEIVDLVYRGLQRGNKH